MHWLRLSEQRKSYFDECGRTVLDLTLKEPRKVDQYRLREDCTNARSRLEPCCSHSLSLHSKLHLIASFAGLKRELAYQVYHWLIYLLNVLVY